MTVFPLYHVLSVRASMSFMIPNERTLFHLTRLEPGIISGKGQVAELVGKIVWVLDCNIRVLERSSAMY